MTVVQSLQWTVMPKKPKKQTTCNDGNNGKGRSEANKRDRIVRTPKLHSKVKKENRAAEAGVRNRTKDTNQIEWRLAYCINPDVNHHVNNDIQPSRMPDDGGNGAPIETQMMVVESQLWTVMPKKPKKLKKTKSSNGQSNGASATGCTRTACNDGDDGKGKLEANKRERVVWTPKLHNKFYRLQQLVLTGIRVKKKNREAEAGARNRTPSRMADDGGNGAPIETQTMVVESLQWTMTPKKPKKRKKSKSSDRQSNSTNGDSSLQLGHVVQPLQKPSNGHSSNNHAVEGSTTAAAVAAAIDPVARRELIMEEQPASSTMMQQHAAAAASHHSRRRRSGAGEQRAEPPSSGATPATISSSERARRYETCKWAPKLKRGNAKPQNHM
ncbi:hypothetical protein HU200_021403 [Digitaria exilis]|uniref:Uncharacterized protein n=1 Tax=Digitaria exilis TaxID=1010633 RepID=A0A835F0B0_9POAL|nr:hypothetical protein HU200_021403 [Digitaria exilis]